MRDEVWINITVILAGTVLIGIGINWPTALGALCFALFVK